MRTSIKKCSCSCNNIIQNELWDICLGDCDCKTHHYKECPNAEEIEKKKALIKWLKAKKEAKNKDNKED